MRRTSIFSGRKSRKVGVAVLKTFIQKYLPEVKKYLDLPPGYRFLIDGNNYEDVWFEAELLNA